MRTRRPLFALVLVVLLLALAFALWQVSNREIAQQLVASAEVTGEQFGLRFVASVRERLLALAPFELDRRAGGALAVEEFTRLAPGVARGTSGLVALLLVDDQGRTLAAEPPDYGTAGVTPAQVRGWITAARPAFFGASLTGVVDLPGRQRGLVATLPVGGLDGAAPTVVAVLSLSDLVGGLFGEAIRNRYGIELRDGRGGIIFLHRNRNADARFDPRNAITKPIGLGAQELSLTVRPYATVTVPLENRNGWLILGLGSLLSLVIGLVFWEIGARAETLERMVRDRTAQLEEKHRELEVQHQRALEATQLKGEFLANMTHELKSPIHSILALSDLLAQGLGGDTLTREQERQVGFIHRSGEDLLELIEAILTSVRIEAEKVDVVRAPTRVGEVLRSLAELSDPLVTRKGLRFALEVGEELLAPVPVDEEKVRVVVGNLLSNAIKFTPEGGSVIVHAALEPAAADGASGTPVSVLVVTVSDTGIGIAREHHELIFEAFRQVDGSIRRRFGGTGLGLALARKLAQQMDGAIDVESEVGSGSTFRFRLPVPRAREDRSGAVLDAGEPA